MLYEKDKNSNIGNNQGQNVSQSIDNKNYLPQVNEMSFSPFVIKKTEKLVTALYMVTDCMEGDEPLKAKLRTLGVDILSKIRRVYFRTPIETINECAELVNAIEEIISFLEIAQVIGFISDMNHQILQKEFFVLHNSLADMQKSAKVLEPKSGSFFESKRSANFSLDESLFYVDPAQMPKQNFGIFVNRSIGKTEVSTDSYKGQIKDNAKMSFINQKQPTQNTNEKSDRRDKILSLVKAKGEVMIKDISTSPDPILSACSEKTIQRELLALIEKNVLKKTGEKRWSRYSLA